MGFASTDIEQAMAELQSWFNLQQLIATRSEKEALIFSNKSEFHSVIPEPVKHIVDTVGAGDAFSAIFIHGLNQAGQ